MDRRAWHWGLLLVCWPLLACAGEVGVRVTPLPAAPILTARPVPPAAAENQPVVTRIWLRAPRDQTVWYALRVAHDWSLASPPLLTIAGNTRARVTAYLPPDYRPHSDTVFSVGLDPTFSRHGVVYRLPADLRADEPIYLQLGNPGQSQPIQIGISDEAGYRADDLRHVRASTFFASVQLSMAMVILCFWLVLRDRMFLYFIVYVGAQAVYQMATSGELFTLPGAGLLAPLGFHTGQAMACIAAAFSIWFILAFADLRIFTPRLAAALGTLRWPLLACGVLIWVPLLDPDAWLPNTVNLLLVVSTIVALASTGLAWWRGNRQAGFFLLSWVPLLALTMLRVVQLVAGYRLPVWLEYGFPASMAYAAVIITAGLADRTLQVRRERDQATHMAQFDPLTGVLNRRAITDRLRRAWRDAAVTAQPLALLFLDIDHFKQVNDTRGHAAGDACLVAVTGAIRAELGEADRAGRYGGEEFLIVLRGDSARMALPVAERIVTRAAALRVMAEARAIGLTVSIGVAVRDATVPDVEVLVRRADEAQYRAKAEGRNRVVVWRAGIAAQPLVGVRQA